MPERHIIVIGTSAGGVEALQSFAKTLPTNFEASIFVTLHFPEHGTSVLPRILSRVSPIPAVQAVDGERIVPGRIYVAPPDYHLLLSRQGVHLARGPKENGHRPAIDPMFRSAAIAYGPRVIGVVLSGNLDDGTAGIAAIKRRGGLAVVQDPDEASFPSMPQSVIDNVGADRVVKIRELAQAITELMHEPLPHQEPAAVSRDLMENELSAGNVDAMSPEAERPGTVSGYGCPDCGGVLWELQDGELTRYRCRVGHAWTSEALLAQQSDTLDAALWTALRALEESAALARQISERYVRRGADRLAERFDERANTLEGRAAVVRNALMTDHAVVVTSQKEPDKPRRVS